MKICKGCGLEKRIWSKGLCQMCASKTYKPLKSKGTIKVKFKPKKNKDRLDTFFEIKIDQLRRFGKSEESGKLIPLPTRGNICHILDKSRHSSVGDHPDNYVFLTWDEHARFDQLLFAHEFAKIEKEFPNSWGIILKRLESVIPSCVEKTKLLEALETLTEI